LHAKDYPTAFAPIRPVSSHNATGAAPLADQQGFGARFEAAWGKMHSHPFQKRSQ
jgi:hypothetical protein